MALPGSIDQGCCGDYSGIVADLKKINTYIKNMPIRLRAIVIIIVTNVIIILFSVFVGIGFVQGNITRANETDLSLVSDIADHFISGEIDSLRLKTNNIVHNLAEAGETEWPEVAVNQVELYQEFIGLAVFNAQGGRIFSMGGVPAPPEAFEDPLVQSPRGNVSFSSTYPSSVGMVFYVAAPLPEDRILVLTLPGMHFSDRFNQFVIWETGHLFMVDAEGNMIANMRENWVQGRINFFREAERNREEFGDVAAVLERVVKGETGVGYFSMAGVPRLCSYRPVSASQEGWGMGIIAPLPESPFRNIDQGLIMVGFVALTMSIAASVFFSRLITKPFEDKELAETSSRYKSTFLASMSHEIRTPMNAITGMTELALREDMSPNVRSHLLTIKQAGSNLISIINDILDFSKVEAGLLEIKPEVYRLSSLIDDTVNVIRMKLLEKPLRFYLNIDSKLPKSLRGDEVRLRQILINLLSNAVKYTDRGNISLGITEDKREGDTVWLRIVVTDTGHGIKKEDQKKLFGEFVQFDINKENIEGTGLGLAITKRLCTAMGGEISFESEYA